MSEPLNPPKTRTRALIELRAYYRGISRWELADLLGIDPHHLDSADLTPILEGQSVRHLIDLSAQLDLHPADLVPALAPLLDARRTGPGITPHPADHTEPNHADAETALAALATAGTPHSAEDLAFALGWTLERTRAALAHAEQHPALAGPLALHRGGAHTYTLAPRTDRLNDSQHQHLSRIQPAPDPWTEPLTGPEATVLYAALHGPQEIARLHEQHLLEAIHALKLRGILIQTPDGTVLANQAVFSSLRRTQPPRKPASPRPADAPATAPDPTAATLEDRAPEGLSTT